MTGTDTLFRGLVPGFALHREIAGVFVRGRRSAREEIATTMQAIARQAPAP